ncbi:MAG: CapA family protein [Polyangiaceae bacterium]
MTRLSRRCLLLGAGASLGCAPTPGTFVGWVGGDVHLGRAMGPLLVGLGLVGPGFVNLEGPVAERPAPCHQAARSTQGGLRRCLANAPGGLVRLLRAGIEVVGIANNHALDRGPEGRDTTLRALRGVGLAPSGAPWGAPRIVQRGRGVAFTSVDLHGQGPDRLRDELSRAGEVVAFHVTGPPSYLPTPELREAVDLALAAGARVVVAHGSHALGAVERRGGAVIAWGLGNLAFACDCTEERDGLLLQLELDDAPPRVRVIPIDAGLGGAPATPASDPALTFELLAALGSSPIGDAGWLS